MAIIFGLTLVPVAGFAGTALDYSRAAQAQANLQAAADAAAFGAIMMRGGPSDAERQAEAERIFRGNLAPGVTGNLASTIEGRTATVAATAQVPTAMLPVIGIDSIDIHVTSSATKVFQGPPVCVLALNRSANGAVTFSGNANFVADQCAVHSNSSHSNALVVNGSASVTAAGFCAVGGADAPARVRPEPQSECDVLDDPFEDLAPPSTSGCTYNDVKVKPNQQETLHPGIYCNGLEIKGEAELRPGVYVIKNGPLTINSQAAVTGEGVTFYLTGTGAGFSFNGGGELELTAPLDGPYGGILIFQDRSSSPGATNTINGNSDGRITGAIYTAKQQLTVNGSSGFLQSVPFLSIVADQVKITGSATASVDLTGITLPAPLPLSFSGARLSY